ncbi:MAG: HEAT repeat domain-containing protein [Candidatus Hydrothermales bacterium]
MIVFLLFLFISENEIEILKDLLSYQFLEIKDLGFEKDKSLYTNLKDTLTLSFLKDPLNLALYSEKFYKNFMDEEKRILEKIFNFKIEEKNFYEILPKSLRSLKKAKILIKESTSKIKREKLDTLIFNLTSFFAERKSIEKKDLYAVFEKEKGRKIEEIIWDEKKISEYLLKIDKRKLFDGLNLAFINLFNLTLSLLISHNLKDTSIKTEMGCIVINLKDENNIYSGDSFFIIFDLKGEDRYIGRVGFSSIFYSVPFSIIIDKEGNDFYFSDKIFSISSSFFGVSISFDLQGEDIRKGRMFSISSSMFGIAFLMDKKGKDIYESDFFSQASSFFGKSLLFDLDGDDLYKLTEMGQSFSSTEGFSILFDKSGNDSYIAYGKNFFIPLLPDETNSFAQGFSLGIRPYLGGGVSFLIDREGNDVYYSEVYGQGCGYFYGSGVLIDEKGNDLYHLTEYGQGAGIHLAVGGLFDLDGDDDYISRFGPAQGEGHDYSVGILIDKRGHDTYKVSGGQGIGLNTSVGIFVDVEGNDLYVTTEELGQGGGKMSRGKIGIGIFVDLKGKDNYRGEYIKNEPFLWTKGELGFGFDIDTVATVYKEEEGALLEIQENLEIDSLFKIASEWEVGSYKKIVPEARKRLSERKKEALDYIFKRKIKTLKGLELRAIREVIKNNKELSLSYLKDALKKENDTLKQNVIYLIGEAELREMEQILWEILKREKKDYIKASIIYSLSKLKTESYENLFKYLKEKDLDVRISTIRACGEIKKKKFLIELVPLLKDENSLVRFAVEKVLSSNADSIKELVINNSKKESDERTLFHYLRILQEVKDTTSDIIEIFLNFSDSKSIRLKAEAIKGLNRFKNEKIEKKLKEIKETEKNNYLLWLLRNVN